MGAGDTRLEGDASAERRPTLLDMSRANFKCAGAGELEAAQDEPDGERRKAQVDQEAKDVCQRRHGHGR